MNHTKSILLTLFVLATSANVFSAPCIPETLSYYKTNYGELNACTSGVLNFFSFDFSKLSAFGSVTANDIYITPDPSQDTLLFNGVNISTFNHVVLPGQAEQYLISYVIDPPPIVAGDDLTLDPPTGPIYVSRWSCTDQPFSQFPTPGSITGIGPTSYANNSFECLNGANPYFLQVSPLTQLSASVTFAVPARYVFTRMAIDLLPGEVTGLEGIVSQSQTTVPEPGTFIPAALALAGMAFHRLRRR